MKIISETGSYNHRRYGKPWIAKVDFSESTKGEFVFGDWTGDHYNGGEGVLTIDANPGDIVAIGQKDFRKPSNSAAEFSVVGVDGGMEDIGDKGNAYKYFLEHKGNVVAQDFDTLRKERDALVTRLAEIDAILGK